MSVPTGSAEREPQPGPAARRPIAFVEVDGGHNKRPLLRHGRWPLLWSLTRQQLATRYRQSSLHLAWIVVQPMAFVGIYALFFKGVLQVDSGDVPYIAFIVAGIIPWRFVANGLSNSSSIIDKIHLISKVYFPKELIPLAGVCAGLVDLAFGTFIMVAVIAISGTWPTYHIVALPLVYLLLFFSTATISIVLAALTVFIRDITHAMTFILIGFFFATPIMYTEDQLPTWLQWFPDVNPFAVAISDIRDLVLYNQWFPIWPFLSHLVIAGAMFVAALAYVRSVESRMVDLA